MPSGVPSIAEITRLLVEDAEYRRELTRQISDRTAEPEIIRALVAYARRREATIGPAMARKVLTDAGVSWEAL